MKFRLFYIPLLIISSLTACVASVGAQGNADIQINQQIKLIDCIVTSVGSSKDTRCAGAIMPTVNSLTISGGSPIKITGTFDSASTHSMRVLLDGRWYVSGKDVELQVGDDSWMLRLANGTKLAPGFYNVVVEIITKQGLMLRDTTDEELMIVSQNTQSDELSSGTESDAPGSGRLDPESQVEDSNDTSKDDEVSSRPKKEDNISNNQLIRNALDYTCLIMLVGFLLWMIGYQVWISIKSYSAVIRQ